MPSSLSEERIRQLAAAIPPIKLYEQFPVELAVNGSAGILFYEDGRYSFQDSTGSTANIQVSGACKAVSLTGPWHVNFPAGRGAPSQISMPELMSLHKHFEEGIKYFSGTAIYQKDFTVPPNAIAKDKRLYLDL